MSIEDRILSAIVAFIAGHGYPPTVREIGFAVGLRSSGTVHHHLERLEKRGLIERNPRKPRAMRVR